MTQHTVPPDGVEDIEQQLKLSLHRVEPRSEFVTHLQDRLVNPPPTKVENRQSLGCAFFLLLFSFLSGILLIGLLRHLRALLDRKPGNAATCRSRQS